MVNTEPIIIIITTKGEEEEALEVGPMSLNKKLF